MGVLHHPSYQASVAPEHSEHRSNVQAPFSDQILAAEDKTACPSATATLITDALHTSSRLSAWPCRIFQPRSVPQMHNIRQT